MQTEEKGNKYPLTLVPKKISLQLHSSSTIIMVLGIEDDSANLKVVKPRSDVGMGNLNLQSMTLMQTFSLDRRAKGKLIHTVSHRESMC